MNCAETGCSNSVEWICSYHNIAFCYPDWKKHNRICKSLGILIEDAQLLVIEQIRDLNQRISRIQKQIVDIGGKLISSINDSILKALDSLHKQKKYLMNVILKCLPKNYTEKYLDLIPKNVNEKQPNKVIFEIEPNLDFKEFNEEVNNLDTELKLENMKNDCKKQGIKLFEKSLIQEIKLSKDSSYVFICKFHDR